MCCFPPALLPGLIAAWTASSRTPPSARRTCRCLTARRETPAITRTAARWSSSAPVRRSIWTSSCPTRRRSPSTSPRSPTACPIKSAPSAGSRPRCLWASCVLMSTAMRWTLALISYKLFFQTLHLNRELQGLHEDKKS